MVKAPTRFSHEEWTLSNKTKYRNAELERMAAQRLENESDRLIDETYKRTTLTLADVNKKLDQRIDDVDHWRDEVDKKLKDITDECDKLCVYIKRMEQAVEEGTQEPLHVTQTCLLYREGRKGIDLVHDDVQKELLKEVEVHHGVQALLQKTTEQAREQLRLNRKAKYNLEQDLIKKERALNTDQHARDLAANSQQISHFADADVIPDDTVSPEEWQDCTDANILNAEKQRQNSLNMRSIIDGILQQTANDQMQQVEFTNRAFKRRIAETRDSKGKLEEHLARVLKEIANMEENIANLEKAIADKDDPLKLAETRSTVRLHTRIDIENARDTAVYRTVEEIREIKCDINELHRRLKDSNDSMKALRRRQLDLEEQIQIKENTLFIDEVQCMGIRGSIRINSY